MKKVLSLAIVAVLILAMTGCGATNSANPPANVSGNDTPAPAEVTITETLLVDESGIKITAKSLSNDGLFGPELKLLIENESGKNLTVQSRNTSVNGYMIEPMLSTDVATGKKANDTLVFSSSDLETCGITTIADMEFSFHIFTTDDWETYLDTDPIQLNTSAAATYEYTYDDSGDIAYEKDGIKIVVKGLSQDELLGPSIVVYIENTGKKNITVQTREVSINGYMVEPIFSCDVVVGKHAVDTITFLDSELEENEITEIETVDLTFHIFDADSWTTITDTKPITIDF